MVTVKWNELLTSFEFVSSSGVGENEAFLGRDSGAIYWRSALGDDIEELPDDIDDGGKYVRIPDRRELDLGKPLALDFAAAFLPDDFDDVRRMFGRKGAYGRFKNLLERRRTLERWYAFEAEATEKALREWCKLNDITIDV